MVLDANPGLSWREVQDILVRTSVMTDPSHPDWIQNGAGLNVNHDYGFGSIDAAAAVALATDYTRLRPEETLVLPVTNVNEAIPDGAGSANGVSASIGTSSELSVESVEVTFSATHATRGDLEVILTSPAGTELSLIHI